ncbi:hypothetical protein EDB84DRAFT_1631236 [Lactarius hengduanensis]|nr:hypothetical protein EDB84DRAFT_1631236 [Lactarius hengduanensis]
MSKVINVSDNLGKLLLGGWTPSDRTCPVEECGGVPLLRSPEGRGLVTWFCPSCEGDGTGEFIFFVPNPGPGHSESQQPSSPSLTSSTHYSRSSTPPTDDAYVPGSPIFAVPAETEDSIRRRQQSDLASAEIGNRLLRGWAMLADECPGRTCYGIPLVRPPKTGHEKSPRKECVVCGTVYVTEKKAQGLDSLVPVTSSGPRQEESSGALLVGSNATLKGKEKASGNRDVPVVAPRVAHSASPAIGTSFVAPAVLPLSRELGPPLPSAVNHAFSEPTEDVLASSWKALGATLSALSQRLLLLSSQPILDPVTISQTADAIARTGQALEVISTLRRRQD